MPGVKTSTRHRTPSSHRKAAWDAVWHISWSRPCFARCKVDVLNDVALAGGFKIQPVAFEHPDLDGGDDWTSWLYGVMRRADAVGVWFADTAERRRAGALFPFHCECRSPTQVAVEPSCDGDASHGSAQTSHCVRGPGLRGRPAWRMPAGYKHERCVCTSCLLSSYHRASATLARDRPSSSVLASVLSTSMVQCLCVCKNVRTLMLSGIRSPFSFVAEGLLLAPSSDRRHVVCLISTLDLAARQGAVATCARTMHIAQQPLWQWNVNSNCTVVMVTRSCDCWKPRVPR